MPQQNLYRFNIPNSEASVTLFLFCPFQDLHVYISQNEIFTDFNDTEALFWFQQDLVYGDWTTGDQGCYEQYKELDIPEVGV